MPKSVSPALISEIASLRAEVASLSDRLDSILSQLNQLNEPPKEILLSNAEARFLLGTQGKPIGEKALCERMNKGIYIEGIHYTGTRTNRRWKKSRLEFWIDYQRDEVALKRRMFEWAKEDRSA